jgi:hypothetical protein
VRAESNSASRRWHRQVSNDVMVGFNMIFSRKERKERKELKNALLCVLCG